MKFDIMTLFPDMVTTVLSESIIGRASRAGKIEFECHNIRDYSENKHRNVDDTPYGGGMGMVMAAPPIYNCFCAVKEKNKDSYKSVRTIYMSPKGRVLTQEIANELKEYDNIIILCGHYEGVDQRVLDEIIDEEISIGDYVLTGGELPACILVDCVSRLLEGVLSSPECYERESIAAGLLEHPQYTRPYEFHGVKIPDVLISGHHENIEKWRHEQSLQITGQRRPEMLRQYLEAHPPKEKKKRRKEKLSDA
jgi:tRNA (guanine37-N1)-methyltransferase